MFYGIAALGAFQYSLMAKLEPIFTALFSVIVLNQVLGFYQYLGIVLVVGSLSAYQLLQKKQQVVPAKAGADEYL
jgi:drug/metabolite transporter (DMT)-like permease